MDTQLLIKRIESGDRSAFAEVVGHFQRPLFGYLGRMGLSQAQAEEVAQDTFLRAWQRWADYDPGKAALSTWLFTIARNLAFNELTRASAVNEGAWGDAPQDVAGEQGEPEPEAMARQRREQLRQALRALPPGDRSALALAYFEELDLAGIARIEGCSLAAIKVRLHRAKQRLRELLENTR
ncbi:sigma-70 family RNA polymerase sigma factor [Aquabacterium sp.]|uniref:RNA polymerase sigma factor n=1 Tax=Aquabacterium sp. TaxID=1872578 RepID=UPI0025C6D963|nr:sigma-70 family RNA polymerase sigma factor [Aquabacterium sp.]